MARLLLCVDEYFCTSRSKLFFGANQVRIAALGILLTGDHVSDHRSVEIFLSFDLHYDFTVQEQIDDFCKGFKIIITSIFCRYQTTIMR